jgi:hypothetical protein
VSAGARPARSSAGPRPARGSSSCSQPAGAGCRRAAVDGGVCTMDGGLRTAVGGVHAAVDGGVRAAADEALVARCRSCRVAFC